MSIVVRTRTWLIIAFCLILATFASGWYFGHKSANNASDPVINALNHTISHQDLLINDQQHYATTVEQENSTLKEAVKSGLIEKEALKLLHYKTVSELTHANLTIDTLLTHISHNGHIVSVHDTVFVKENQKCILLPFSWYKKDQFLSLTGNFDFNGNLSVALKLSADVDIVSGFDRKTKKYQTSVITDSPYISILSIRSSRIDVPREKHWNFSVVGGYGMAIQSKPQLVPFIGISVGRTIFAF